MSRSERHTLIIKCGGYGKYGKHLANKKVRHSDVDDGNAYRKVFNSYDIYDMTYNLYRNHNAVHHWTNYKMTIEEIMWYWRK